MNTSRYPINPKPVRVEKKEKEEEEEEEEEDDEKRKGQGVERLRSSGNSMKPDRLPVASVRMGSLARSTTTPSFSPLALTLALEFEKRLPTRLISNLPWLLVIGKKNPLKKPLTLIFPLESVFIEY